MARPYRFLDLACGDASGIAAALKGTPIQQYRGVDLSAPALAIASANLAALPCPAELDEADFSTALRDPSRAADIVWISLSLHHLDTAAKLAFMREVRQRIDANGAFLIYEPARRDGEDRPAYLDRLEAIGRRDWTELTPARVRRGVEARAHVRFAGDGFRLGAAWAARPDFPPRASCTASPTDLFRLFLYQPLSCLAFYTDTRHIPVAGAIRGGPRPHVLD